MQPHRPIGSRRRLFVPLSTFLLTCTLAACDLPGGSDSAASKNVASGEELIAIESASSRTAMSAPLTTARVSLQPALAAQPASTTVPSGVSDVELTPMEDAGDPAGNALLAVRFFDRAEPAEDIIKLVVDDKQAVLTRDPANRARFSGMIFFDFDLFAQEQAARRALLTETKDRVAPLFQSRELVAEEEFGFVEPAAIAKARAASTTISVPRRMVAMPPSAVDPRRELFITDLSVVQDPTRTFDICGNVGNPNGAWTFKTLMTNMANQPATGIDPSLFVENWLRTWTINNTVNTFPVPARPNIGVQVLNSWPRLTNGRLNLDRSPFRLLAIVNRIDLRGNTVYGGGNAGEGRFVFAVVNRNNNGGCSVMQFTVIFEYGVPISGCTNVKNYAQQWVNLGNIALGSPAFNPALQAITDQFTAANAAPRKPNRSALNQLRTDEIALAVPWELREYVLPQGNGNLTLTTAKQTPHHTRNNTALLANYINVNSAAILNGTHVVPLTWVGQPFLTGSNFNFSVVDGAVWNAPGVGNQQRHKFSLATCNACHGGETRANGNPVALPLETSFVHITPRLQNQQSQLSKFLLGTGTLALPTTFPKNDPINGVPQRTFGDLLQRQVHLANLMNSSCLSSALIHELRFQPLDMVH
ncbi:MAG: hypothetical protein KA144_05500 [Xanthomonadaceae bacterium]|nr:hypothetical protein [Xanthomonadaceae bacterium]